MTSRRMVCGCADVRMCGCADVCLAAGEHPRTRQVWHCRGRDGLPALGAHTTRADVRSLALRNPSVPPTARNLQSHMLCGGLAMICDL